MKVLVTGGTGFIGSHTAVELLDAGHEVVIVDNLSNSSPLVVDRIEKLTGNRPIFVELDICDTKALSKLAAEHEIDGVIHFAAYKAVGESVEQPLKYYRNNIDGLLSVLEVMTKQKIKQLVFSSSCTVYGQPDKVPVTEDSATTIDLPSPYGKTKAMAEQILMDIALAYPDLQITSLRYFNPVGAHPSGLIGEDPAGVPSCLMPYITQVAIGKLPQLRVFGNDYPTKDGTGIRDYIHVVDLAKAHLTALNRPVESSHVATYNIGTGRGYSVLEIIEAFEAASGQKIPYKVVARRPGDIAASFADPSKARRELNWQAEFSLSQMCADAWNWQSTNPDGYKSPGSSPPPATS